MPLRTTGCRPGCQLASWVSAAGRKAAADVRMRARFGVSDSAAMSARLTRSRDRSPTSKNIENRGHECLGTGSIEDASATDAARS